MKKIFLLGVLVSAANAIYAQDSFLNNQLINNSDLYGSARYVGMGGAMGALGADISTMGWNPAGIGLMRKGEVSITAGGIWDKVGSKNFSKGSATLDHAGIVFSIKMDDDSALRFLNFGFNYQKKINYNNSFEADNNNLKGLSQLDPLAELTQAGYNTKNNLAGFMYDCDMFDQSFYEDEKTGEKKELVRNLYEGTINRYTQHTYGSLNGFDFNFSGNVNERFYWGFDLGFDNLRYRAQQDYYEEKKNKVDKKFADHTLRNDMSIDGWGLNFKFGAIVRPVEDNPFRLGLAIETPTWYNFKRSTFYNLAERVSDMETGKVIDSESFISGTYESYLEYSLRTPWKVRLSAGSTVSNYLAWGVDYEFANYASTSMGYPYESVNDARNSVFRNRPDKSMNQLTKDNLKGVHTLRVGVEAKPTKSFALRMGYNYSTSAYKKKVNFDQLMLDSPAMDYTTTTDYIRLGDAHTITLGLGYKWSKVYIDIAYKARSQKADYFAFDSNYTQDGRDFASQFPNEVGKSIDPVEVDLTKHQLTATLGIKF